MGRVDRGSRSDDDEEGHDVQHQDAGDGVDPLVLQVVGMQSLVRDVGLLKKRHPWRDRRADDRDEDEDEWRREVERRNYSVMDDIAPLRVGKERRNDVAKVDQGEEQQDALYHTKRPPQNQKPDQQGGERDRGV